MKEQINVLGTMTRFRPGSHANLVRNQNGQFRVDVNYYRRSGDSRSVYEVFDLDGVNILPSFHPVKQKTDEEIISFSGELYALETQPDGEVTTQRVRMREGRPVTIGFDGRYATHYDLTSAGYLTEPVLDEHRRVLNLFSRYPEGLYYLGKGLFKGSNGFGMQAIDLSGEALSGFFDDIERDTEWHSSLTGIRHSFSGNTPVKILNYLDNGRVVERRREYRVYELADGSFAVPILGSGGPKYGVPVSSTYSGFGVGRSTGVDRLDKVFPEGVESMGDATFFGKLDIVKLMDAGFHVVNLGEGVRYGPYTSVNTEDGRLVARADFNKSHLDGITSKFAGFEAKKDVFNENGDLVE